MDIVGTLRREIPDIILRTTLITGFPGETQEDHEELMEFIDTGWACLLILRKRIPRRRGCRIRSMRRSNWTVRLN